MSTRGVIARPIGDVGWEGRYNHSDSYASYLGKRLWDSYHYRFGDIDDMIRYAIDEHPMGWSIFPDSCYCHDWDRGESDNMCMFIAGDPEQDGDPLFMEWVYILTPQGMDVLASRRIGDTDEVLYCDLDGTVHYEGVYEHQRIAFVNWTDPEPDWDALDAARYSEEASLNHA